ncbi:autotransporter assembly complex protein TamA [Noviherbaspirillum saxi]|uniref:Translocation and assembly module subunit TamA n=1 Tax=Noviherbaspirillum saxi TaxID=2320863 RepID=A0A3A3FWG8_9BURK|nr:autotransporter assembly complex family protein [Noviherbaspirillum saxi]RJF98501.1 outer membrane protein assembly factor [Noviherbaspirillum saxi]
MLSRSARSTRTIVALLCALGVALASPDYSYAVETAARYVVEINGAGRFRELLEEHLELRRHRSDPELSDDGLERLVNISPEQVRALLATEGYFSPEVQVELDRRMTPPVARLQVDPGLPTRIADVQIRFKGAIADGAEADVRRMERLKRRWSLDPGETFTQKSWTEAKNDLLKDLLNRDFPAAAIAFSEARIDPEKRSAALTVEVDSGPVFTFGELDVQGLTRYSREMIDRLNPIKPGERYSQEKLNELQTRLEETGYFRSAFATVDVDPAQAQNTPVRVDLAENPRKRLSLGVGFSTDTGARAQVKWLDRNFLMRDWRLESELRIDRETRLLGGDVYLPALRDGRLDGWQPAFGAHYERTVTSGEIVNKMRLGARISSPNRVDEKTWGVSYLADRQRIGDFVNNRQALIATFVYTRRRLDHPLTPRRGYVASVELGAGPSGLINETNLGRLLGRVTWLTQPAPRWRTVVRAQAGQVFGGTRQTVPADLLFRTGGDQSVRGYGYNSLGVEQNGAIVGGTVTAIVSAEVVRRLTPDWGAALFHDAGNAADSWGDFRFRHGTGVGARWRSPLGPVNIDLAYGHTTREPRLHFSIGYGF